MQSLQQTQKLSTSLSLTPQMRQSLHLLAANAAELRALLREALEQNPLLEEAPEPEPSAQDILDDDYDAPPPEGAREAQRRHNSLMDSLAAPEAPLRESLLEQALFLNLDDAEKAAFAYLADNLDENGFLSGTPEELARAGGFDLETATRALRALQSAEPAGIGARDLRECLRLQLERAGKAGSLAWRIVQNDFDKLAARKVREIARAENVPLTEVERALGEISRLNPAPARAFAAQTEPIILPDLVFEKTDGHWRAVLNESALPKLRLSPEYKHLLARERLSEADREYLSRQIREGRGVLAALAQRRKTLESIGNALAREQGGFFERGPDALKPLTMARIAEDIGVHEATVSRAVAEKYADTPWGVLPLRRFFSNGYAGEGEAASADAVKRRIAEMIRAEDARRPLSDEQIAERLAQDGAAPARRTVAKYREALGLPPARQRRRFS